MEAGETFKMSSSSHLWVVISDPRMDRQRVAVVNFSSVKGNRTDDEACLLDVGDHPWITRKTFVAYGFAQIKSDAELERGIGGGGYIPEDPVSSELLSKIRRCVADTDRMPIAVENLLDEQGFLE